MNDQVKSATQIAQSIGLVDADTTEAINIIANDILLTMYGNRKKSNPDQDVKIRAMYEEMNPGATWMDDNDKVLSVLLLGPPGQGKTMAFKQAAKKVAAGLGLTYVENPSDKFKVDSTHFVFISQEFSAENSKVSLGGIPSKVVEDDVEYMSMLVNKRLAMMHKSGGGLLLLDDFPNASPNIQNVGLALTDEKRFQGLDLNGNYVGLTGNLGALDGTHTARLSTALRGRCRIMFTEDKLENFINRCQKHYRDDLGDVGMLGFLARFPQHFSVLPSVKESGGFPSPRTWDHFITEARRELNRAGGRGRGELKCLPKLQKLASSLLGLEVGQEVYAYMYSLMRSADPLARQMIMEGKNNTAELEKRFKDGFSADEQHFAYQYATALSDYAVLKIVKDGGKMDEAVTRFAQGMVALPLDSFAYAVNNFKGKLANQVASLSTVLSDGRNSLTTDSKKKIVDIVVEVKGLTQEHVTNLVDVLTDASKFDVGGRVRTRRKNK